MLYNIKGMSPDRIRKMTRKERSWWLNRIHTQFKREHESIEKAQRRHSRVKTPMKYGV